MRTKIWSLILFILCLLLIGGCGMDHNNQEEEIKVKPSEMAPADLPKNRAFEHEFTRGFLQSTEEIENGYYPFVSGTGRYKMWFPAGAQIGDKGYAVEGDYYEQYLLHIRNDSGSESGITINYQALRQQEFYEDNLKMLERRIEKDLKFEEIKLEGRTLYVAPLELEHLEGYAEAFGYVGYIQNTQEAGGITISYNTHCYEGDEVNCEDIIEEEQAEMVRWMSQVEFLPKNNEDEGAK